MSRIPSNQSPQQQPTPVAAQAETPERVAVGQQSMVIILRPDNIGEMMPTSAALTIAHRILADNAHASMTITIYRDQPGMSVNWTLTRAVPYGPIKEALQASQQRELPVITGVNKQ